MVFKAEDQQANAVREISVQEVAEFGKNQFDICVYSLGFMCILKFNFRQIPEEIVLPGDMKKHETNVKAKLQTRTARFISYCPSSKRRGKFTFLCTVIEWMATTYTLSDSYLVFIINNNRSLFSHLSDVVIIIHLPYLFQYVQYKLKQIDFY